MNIRVIDGANNREYVAKLVTGYNNVINLARIMKNFMVIRTMVSERDPAQAEAS